MTSRRSTAAPILRNANKALGGIVAVLLATALYVVAYLANVRVMGDFADDSRTEI
jgi:hypothetical protein